MLALGSMLNVHVVGFVRLGNFVDAEVTSWNFSLFRVLIPLELQFFFVVFFLAFAQTLGVATLYTLFVERFEVDVLISREAWDDTTS